jgi:eukaryotic-like serine/threonine-protein kinase
VSDSLPDSLSPSAVERIDETCDRFEAAWKGGGLQPRVEDYLDGGAGAEGDALLQELLRVDAHYRHRAEALTLAGGTVGPSRDVPVVAGYTVLGELGRGGMGVVYKARQLRPNRLVALKMISAGASTGPRELERFLREADAVAHLQHPHIVQVYEVGEQNGLPYVALEYVSGGSLDQYLAATPQPAAAAARLVEQLAHAIHHAHERGIIHRDLKPANILLSGAVVSGGVVSGELSQNAHHSLLSTHQPKITDFGLAKLLEAGPTGPTRSGDVLGTPSYMAPEQVAGGGEPISAATDVYGLGAILYEMLTGRPPFRAESPLETMFQVQTVEPVAPSRLQPKCPRELATICLKCLAKEARKRYATALELAEDLRRFLDGQPIHARPIGPVQQVVKWMRRQPLVASLAGLLIVAIALGVSAGAWFWWQAELGRREAEDALGKERVAQAARVATLDRYRVALAHREWLANNAGRAEALLDDCTEEQRQSWEWRYLDRLRHSVLRTLSGHGNTVQAIAVHPKGRYVASASHDASVRVWDLDTGRETILGHHDSAVLRVAYSPDGRWLASSATDCGLIKLWDADTGAELPTLEFGKRGRAIWGLAFDPGSRYLAAGQGGRLKVWDMRDQKWAYDQPAAHLGTISQVAFSPDPEGRYLATAAVDVKVWNWKTKATKPLRMWPGHGGTHDLAFSPDGNRLATGGRDRLIRVHDLEKKEEFTLNAHDLAVTCLSFSTDGQRLASAGLEGDMHVWNVKERRKLFTLHGHSGSVFDLAYAGGERIISCGLDRRIRVWDATNSQEVIATPVRVPDARGTLLFSRDSRLLAWVSVGNRGGIWDVVGRKEICRLPFTGGRLSSRALAGSADNRCFAWGCTDGAVRLWDAETRTELPLPKGATHTVVALAFTPDGRLLVARQSEQGVLLSDARTGRQLHVMARPSAPNSLAVFSADARHLALVGGGVVQEWDTDSGRLLRTLPPQPELATILAYSPSGDALAFGGVHGRVWIWDRIANRERMTCAGHPRRVHGLTFSPDGRRLVTSGSDCTAKVWDARTGNEVLALRTQLHENSPLTFSADGADLASVNFDNHLQIWSTRGPRRGAAE